MFHLLFSLDSLAHKHSAQCSVEQVRISLIRRILFVVLQLRNGVVQQSSFPTLYTKTSVPCHHIMNLQLLKLFCSKGME